MEPGQEATRLTVYVGDSQRYGRKALYRAVVEMLHGEGIAGVTVLHGIEGYGAGKRIHTARFLDLSADLPLVIIAVDRTEKIEAVLPGLDAMLGKGLVTTEKARIVLSRPGPEGAG
jgi:PII-like signaling protein